MVVVAVALAVVVYLVPRSNPQAERELERSIRSLAADFPDEVRARGGEESLRDPEFVSAWIRQLESSNGPASDATVPLSAPLSKVQAVLAAMLQRLLADHQQVAKHLQPPTLRIVIVAILIGYVFGHFWGEIAFAVENPQQDRFPYFYDFPFFDAAAYAWGFVTGIAMFWALTLLQAWLWYRRLRQLRAEAAERAREIERDYAEVLRVVGGPAALKYAGPVRSLMQALRVHPQAFAEAKLRPEVREQLRQAVCAGWLRHIHDGLLEVEGRDKAPWLRIISISLVLGFVLGELFGEYVFGMFHPKFEGRFPFLLRDRRILDLGAILGAVAMGIFVAATILAAQWLLWRWQRARARAAVQICIQEFQADFVDDIRTWGGPSVLRTSEAVQELLRGHV